MSSSNSLATYPSLRGKPEFVTGGGSGIGEEIVSAFAEQGAKVGFVDIAVDASRAMSERLADAGYEKPLFRQCDIRFLAALQQAMRDLAQTLGVFAVLFYIAGYDERDTIEVVTVLYW